MEATTGYIAIIIERAPSSGAENRSQRVFLSLEGASAWLMEQFESYGEDWYYPAEWDEEDMGCTFPEKEIFSVEALKENIATNDVAYFDKPIWGPQSEYQGQAPIEFFIKKIKIMP